MSLPSKIFLSALALLTLAGVSAPGAESFNITQFLDPKGDASVVVINAGKDQGIVDGAVFEAFRVRSKHALPEHLNASDITITTGELKAFAVHEEYTLARVVVDSTPIAKAMFPKFPGVMAGDWVREKPVAIAANQTITPTVDIVFTDLFIDPHPVPATFELSPQGQQVLREAASQFAGSHLGNLVVAGHTDMNGPSEANQIESYQRALTIRQYLISELGFDPNRVVALGFGEAQPKVSGYRPGYRTDNRRIEMKIVVDTRQASR